jgi:hypothetical protein
MPDFTVTDEIISKISVQFKVPKLHVKQLYELYEEISDAMKLQYLAHVIRTMEDKLRELPGNEMFRIVCSPFSQDSKDLGIASARYYRGRYFAIFYHPKTDEKQLRMLLAHELGHLFLVELFNSRLSRDYTEKTQIEPSSTILGIFTILDKNEFYYNKTSPFKHASPDQVLTDFFLLKNRFDEILNIS